jgi:hypothetical protein
MNIASTVKITLINIDGSPKFSKSQVAIDSLVASFNVSRKRNARHKLVSRRTRDRYEIADLIAASPNLLHLMAHGNHKGVLSSNRFKVINRNFRADVLRAYLAELETYPDIDCVLMDACDTFYADWFEEVARMLPRRQSIIYIGTTDSVSWEQCTTYTSAFYLSFMQCDSIPATRSGRRLLFRQAHQDAMAFYKKVRQEPSPFRLKEIRSALG